MSDTPMFPRCLVYNDGFLGEINLFNDEDSFNIPPGKCIINVGSVGQPRDFDERARYLILGHQGELSPFEVHTL